jgi:hypothetical protein
VSRSIDETRRLISQLKAQERAANRNKPVEITLSMRTGHTLTLDEVKQLSDLGVARTLVGLPLRAFNEEELSRFHDDVMAKA